MSRYTKVALFIIVMALLSTAFFYKTSTHDTAAISDAEFGGVSLRLDYATTEAERERGLGGRESLPSDYGMLFIFPSANYYGFWMKNTLVPLDIFWLDDKGQVVSMALEVATTSYPHVFYPTSRALYVLETAAGFAREHRVATGTPLLLKSFPTVTK